MKKTITVRKLAFDAVLAAMYFALSFISIRVGGNMKISVAGLPILVGALMFGPLDGFLIGLVGSFLEQLISPYGLGPTTLLWILPGALRGAMAGAWAKHRRFELKRWETALVIFITALALTAMNTAAIYIDSKLLGYYSYAYVFGALAARLASGLVTSAVFSLIIPPLLRLIRKNAKI